MMAESDAKAAAGSPGAGSSRRAEPPQHRTFEDEYGIDWLLEDYLACFSEVGFGVTYPKVVFYWHVNHLSVGSLLQLTSAKWHYKFIAGLYMEAKHRFGDGDVGGIMMTTRQGMRPRSRRKF